MDEFEIAGAWLETEDRQRLALRGNLNLGRAADNHVVITGPKASREHATIHVQDESEFWLIDLGSRNGTFRNGHRLTKPTRLRDGDRISLAGAEFIFHQPGGSSASTKAGAGQATAIDFRDQHTWMLIADIEGFTKLSQDLPADQVAMNVGRWIQESQGLVEKRGGRISKFLGDGFLAVWESAADVSRAVADTLGAFHALREAGAVKFRVAIHYGHVTFAGAVQFGEENIIGGDLNYVFRLEKLASELGLKFCASESAHALLDPYLHMVPVPGEHEFKGFAGRQRCYSIRWES
jgi:adenylate cyclase